MEINAAATLCNFDKQEWLWIFPQPFLLNGSKSPEAAIQKLIAAIFVYIILPDCFLQIKNMYFIIVKVLKRDYLI